MALQAFSSCRDRRRCQPVHDFGQDRRDVVRFAAIVGTAMLVCALPVSRVEAIMRLLPGLVLLSLISATPAAAKPKHGREHHEARCYFEPRDVRIIREYYAPRYRSLPPGLAKKFYRTGRLPPGWQKKMEPLPVVVERELVVLPPDYRRGYIDGSIIVYSPHTQIMIDVVPLFRR